MGHKLAIDFGTTKSVIERWDDAKHTAEVISLPGLSTHNLEGVPPLVPSLVYVHDGHTAQITLGQTVRDQELDPAEDSSAVPQFQARRGGDTCPGTPITG